MKDYKVMKDEWDEELSGQWMKDNDGKNDQ